MLAKKYHPDLHPNDAGVAKKFAEINEAMETLGNPQKRKEYDNKRAAEKKQTEAAAAARAAAARAAAARTASARAGMGGATARPYAGTAQGAAAVVNDAYRKGYNEGFAAANAQRNAAAETWKKSADNWQKEAERCRGEVSVLKTALEKTRQRAADAEASARRMEASLSLQRNATEEARRGTAAEAEAKAELREQYEAKIQAEREARRYSDADKVRLSREVMRLKEENDALRARLGEAGAPVTPPVADTPRVTPIIETTPVTPIIETTPVTPIIETTPVTPLTETATAAPPFDTAQSQAEYAQAAGGFADEQFVPHGEQPESDAIADLRARAESGDGDAAVRLGKMYLDGDGAQKDAGEAVRYFTLGMSEGNADALYHLALCCLNGEGTDFDLNRGLQLMHEAAEQGSGMATQFLQEAEK